MTEINYNTTGIESHYYVSLTQEDGIMVRKNAATMHRSDWLRCSEA